MTRFLTIAALFAFAPFALADVESGPKVGDKAEELKVFAVTGKNENKEVELIKERGDEPTIYLFVSKFGRPMNQYFRKIEDNLGKIDEKMAAVAVWVGKDSDKTKEYLPKVQMSMKFEKITLAVFTENETGPKGWALNSDASLTVVVVKKGKVVKTFAYDTVNDTDFKDLETALKEKEKK